MSHFVLKLVKTSVELSEADDTEAISKEVRILLSNRSVKNMLPRCGKRLRKTLNPQEA